MHSLTQKDDAEDYEDTNVISGSLHKAKPPNAPNALNRIKIKDCNSGGSLTTFVLDKVTNFHDDNTNTKTTLQTFIVDGDTKIKSLKNNETFRELQVNREPLSSSC